MAGSERRESSHDGNNNHHATDQALPASMTTDPCLAQAEQHNQKARHPGEDTEERSTTSLLSFTGKHASSMQLTPRSAATHTSFMTTFRSARGGTAQEQESRRHRPPTGALPSRQRPAAAWEKGGDGDLERRRRRATRVARWDDAGRSMPFFPVKFAWLSIHYISVHKIV